MFTKHADYYFIRLILLLYLHLGLRYKHTRQQRAVHGLYTMSTTMQAVNKIIDTGYDNNNMCGLMRNGERGIMRRGILLATSNVYIILITSDTNVAATIYMYTRW